MDPIRLLADLGKEICHDNLANNGEAFINDLATG